jgi:hypothetical protein
MLKVFAIPAAHHFDKLTAFNLLLQQNEFIRGVHSAFCGFMRHVSHWAWLCTAAALFTFHHRHLVLFTPISILQRQRSHAKQIAITG